VCCLSCFRAFSASSRSIFTKTFSN
jgi:hypothetical protein